MTSRRRLLNTSIQNDFEEEGEETKAGDKNQSQGIGPIPISLTDPEKKTDKKKKEDDDDKPVTMAHTKYFEIDEADEEVKRASLWKGKVPLEEYLLYFAFYETDDQ